MDDNQNDGLDKLDAMDAKHGVNKPIEEDTEVVEKTAPITSLGKARSYEAQDLQMSAAEDSPWKLLNLELLPSRGMFYPADVELLIKSAKTKEIRHWSTMDEHDPLDVKEKINFVLNKCTKFKIRGNPQPLNFQDYSDADRYHILFRIYELTFPNQENKLMANLRCPSKKCKHVNKIQVTSRNLLGFEVPEELHKYYSESDRSFTIKSEKLGETLKLYIPSSGVMDKFKQKKKTEIAAGFEIDEAFYKFGPYLVNDWRRLTMEHLSQLKQQSLGWSDNKFTIIHKATEMLRLASTNRATGVCEKCKTRLESSIFLGGSFTVKDIFIVSTRLDELI
jgi:hypothetical protein